MTRINTNVSSLVAQNRLNKTNNDLNTSLTRLSTGLRINTGKDDPAGLIASEALRSDITGINKAISNTQRANQIIATADSALSQVSSLLNDVRGLVVEAANSGALSSDEVAANQLQIDSSLEAINRIAQTTTFQGRKLLDGSLEFLTSAGTNFDKLSDLRIDQANLGATGSVAVELEITAAATKAQVDITNVPASSTPANAFGDVSLSNTIAQASGGTVTINSQALTVAAAASGPADGAEGNGVKNITISYSSGSPDAATYTAGTDTLAIALNGASGTATLAQLQAAAATAGFTIAGGVGSTALTDTTATTTALSGGRDAGSATLRVLADAAGTAANGVTVTLVEDAGIAANTASAAVSGGNIVVSVNGTVSYGAIATEIGTIDGYSASVTTAVGDQNYITTSDAPPGSATTLGGGVAGSGGLAQDVVFALGGADGTETFNFKAGTTISQLASAINLVKDATGVEATVNSTTLELTSSAYGGTSYVDIEVITEGTGGSITTGLGAVSKKRDAGTDVVATVNGNAATGVGNSLSINTATLDVSTSVEAAFTGTVSFTVTGGGALFQLGGDVVSNQQARLGISSVSTGKLGGVSGRLYELGIGQAKSLVNDVTGAGRVIDEVINSVTSLRGRLGAFQATTLESNLVSLNDTIANLTEAESSIRDADFAAESARLTRAQILVQSGTSVLGIANQNPQNVLSLLR